MPFVTTSRHWIFIRVFLADIKEYIFEFT